MLELEFPVSGVPFPLVLPAISLVLIAAAGVFALFAWWTGRARRGDHVTPWDIAAALTFLGCAAAIMGEVEHVIDYFWPQDTRTKPANG